MSSADVKTSQLLQALAGGIEDALAEGAGERMGFVLLTFPFNRLGDSNYISNCDREDMKKALADLLKRWDEGMADIPAYLKN